METAYMAFANQVIELCGSIHASHTAIALAYIEILLSAKTQKGINIPPEAL